MFVLVGMVLAGCSGDRAANNLAVVEVSASDECAQLQGFFSELLSLTNKARQDAGIDELSFSYQLGQAAQGYAEDLATQNFFSHTGKDGSTLVSRIEATGYELAAAGENLAAGQSTAAGVFQQWMESPGHRANILQSEFTEVGFGLFDGTGQSDFGHYWVQNFGKPQSGNSRADIYIPNSCGLSSESAQMTTNPTKVAGIAVKADSPRDSPPLLAVLRVETLAAGVAKLVSQAPSSQKSESVPEPAALAGLSVLGIALWRKRR
jgi:uncharacterized protein YkwD